MTAPNHVPRFVYVLTCTFIACLQLPGMVSAQEEKIRAVPAGATPARATPARPTPGAQPQPGAKPDAKPGQPNPKPDTAAKPDGKKPGDSGSETIVRPQQPTVPPNPAELEARPDEDGLVEFNFKGQRWDRVLEWLADISKLSFDWQELPGDYLNLVTQRKYTIPEARDLINRHLLARGYTILRTGEVMTVVNIKKMNPSFVPRVLAEELKDRDPHEFVKVSFQLDWLLAENAVEELKPMLSPNGTLTKLSTTNRIEAIDAVVNLREIYRLLQEEQSAQGGQERLVRPFRLRYTRASEVLGQLETLLGIDKAPAAPMTPQQMQQMRAMQQQQQQKRGKQAAGPKKEAEVHLVVNTRENSILAHAPPDKMAVIEQAIKAIDVEVDHGQSLLQNMNRMQVYRLAAIDPEPFAKTLEELGNLDPTTHLQVDETNNAIIAYASLADHVTIRALIEKLDGSGRRFHVIPLRRLEADYVGGTIQFMMVGDEKDKNQNQNRSYFGYNPFSRGQENQKTSSDKFRVDADVVHNRLLLWANDIEIKEVENLLMKLGEIPSRGGNPNTMRVLDSIPAEDAEQLLDRIRREWPGLSPNELRIDPSLKSSQPALDSINTPSPEPPSPTRDTRAETPPLSTLDPHNANVEHLKNPGKDFGVITNPNSRLANLGHFGRDSAKLTTVADSQPVAAAPSADATTTETRLENTTPLQLSQRGNVRPSTAAAGNNAAPAPITITRGPDGRLIISSDDTDALDLLEEMMARYAPPRRDFQIFKMKYASTWAYGVAMNLEDFFEDEEKEKGGSGFNPYFGRYFSGGSNTDDSVRLSKRRALKFIADTDTNTILVQGADPQQLRVIKELIDLYDQPIKADSTSVRKTEVFQIRYSKANVIAEAIKDVYRDLLSVNDKALANNNQKKDTPPERSYTYIYGGGGEEGETPESPIKFKGLVSIGVDELSNTLVVSATDGLMQNISEMITALDDAARPSSSVKVIKVDERINTEVLREKLFKMFGKRPAPANGQPNQQNQQNQQNGGPNQEPQFSGERITVREGG